MKSTLFLLLNIITVNAYTQISGITVNPSKPEAGQKITITYIGELAKEGTKMSIILQHTPLNYSPIKGIPTQIINSQLVGSFTLPDSVSYFYIKIANKKEVDNNNGIGYGFNIYKNGKPARGTFLSEGYSIFWNKWNFNGDIDSKKTLNLIEKEYTLNPDMKKSTRHFYVETLSKVPNRKNEAFNLAKQYYDEILKTGIDERFTYYYATILANENFKERDSLLSIVSKKYPKGSLALNMKCQLLSAFSSYKPDTAIVIYKNIKRDFPNITIRRERTIIQDLLSAYSKKLDYENFNKTVNSLLEQDKSQQALIIIALTYNDLAWNLFEAVDLERAKTFAEKSINFHQQYDSLSTYYGEALGTYAAILSKLGDKKGAIFNQKRAVYLKNSIFPDVNQELIQYLIDDNQFEEAQAKAEEFIIDNESSPKIDSLYKATYITINGSEKGFENTLAKIKERAETENTKFLKDKLINVSAPDFELKDLNGKIVKLSDFRGSIVVLDFWATWCGPCIGSFPAMKKVMNELKDKSVKFLFIDTMESEELENKNEKVKKILNSKKVSDFHVLLDEIKDLNYQVTTAYNVPSIPAKFVIDNNGKIRYKSTGFSTDENLIKELKAVIEMISE